MRWPHVWSGILAGILLCAGLTAPSAAALLAVRVVSAPTAVPRGSPVRVEVATTPGAICDIEVRNAAGIVRAVGIRPKRALPTGRIVWLWRVGRTMRTGTWRVAVDCLLGERVGRAEIRFVVR